MPTPPRAPIPARVEAIREPGVRLVPIAGSFAMPERFAATIEPEEESLPACRLELAVEDGAVVVNAVALFRRPGQPPLSPSYRVPLGSYRDMAVDEVLGHEVVEVDGEVSVTIDGETYPLRTERLDDGRTAIPVTGLARTSAWRQTRSRPPEGGRGRRPITAEHLEEVADVYRRGRHRGTQWVMEEWQVPRSTASRWIRRARDEKILGEAIPRAAGERR